MEVVTIKGEVRTSFGKADAKSLRKSGKVPANVYGAGGNISFAVAPFDLKPLIYTPDFKLAEIQVNGKTHQCILKEVQFHPVTDEIVHVDFQKLETGKRVTVQIPVDFQGTAIGVKAGGTLVKVLRRLDVKAKVENLVSHITLDVSAIELGHSLHVRDVEGIDGIEIISPMGSTVAAVEVPRALKSEQAAEEEEGEEEGAEGVEGTTEEGGEETTTEG